MHKTAAIVDFVNKNASPSKRSEIHIADDLERQEAQPI